jgi:hypothetical protein
MAVADRGPGIRQTLNQSYPGVRSDVDALHLAIEKGVTRDESIGQGNGLAGSIRIAKAASGWANLLSGNAMLRLFDDGQLDELRTSPYQGTTVAMTLPTNASIDLTDALWGQRTASTFEFTHVTQDGILFRIVDESTGFGNRGSGLELATKLQNIMIEFPDERVVVDFEGVEVASASFLDEFLAKTIGIQGVTAFFSRYQFRNMNELVSRTADAVISQRLGQT